MASCIHYIGRIYIYRCKIAVLYPVLSIELCIKAAVDAVGAVDAVSCLYQHQQVYEYDVVDEVMAMLL